MITLQLLEPSDTIRPDDWMRPLHLTTMSGGHSDYYSFKSMYGGSPENHVEWVRVRDLLGEYWDGKTVGEYNRRMDKDYDENQRPDYFDSCRYEFVRGDVPVAHQLDMRDYRGARDPLDFDHKTYDQWKEDGRYVKKGEKVVKKNRHGEGLFHRDQTKECW